MTTRCAGLAVAALAVLLFPTVGSAQQATRPALADDSPQSRPETSASLPQGFVVPGGRGPTDLPPDLEKALDAVEDHTPSFDSPAFYALLRYVKNATLFFDPDAPPLKDWQVLIERPASFRGRPVTVEGRVGRNSSFHFQREEHKDLGPVTELQIANPGVPVSCRLVLTNDASDIPIGATVRVTGYFLMAHEYLAPNKRTMRAAVIIAKGPLQVTTTRTRPPLMPQPGWSWLIGALIVGGIVGWIMLRQTAAENRADLRTLRARTSPTANVAEEFRNWAESEELPREGRLPGEHQAPTVESSAHDAGAARRRDPPPAPDDRAR